MAAGKEVVITKRNRPVARLVPIAPPPRKPTFGPALEAYERSGSADGISIGRWHQ